jgi:hypothetical protein
MPNTTVFIDHPSHTNCVLLHLDAYDEADGTRYHDDPLCGGCSWSGP